MNDKHPHLAPFRLLGVKLGVCAECAAEHDINAPHNQQSLAYQYDFYGKLGRFPTWADAIAHCTEDVQNQWKVAFEKLGIKI